MKINNHIRDGKLQYDINREAAKLCALSSGKIRKYEYRTGEDILPSNQQQIIEQAKFTYSLLGKAFEKQIKTIEDQDQKQIDALENLKQNQLRKNLIISQKLQLFLMNVLMKKKIMSKLYDSIDYNNLKFKYVGSTKDVSFCEYKDSKELFNGIKIIRLNSMM